VGAGALRATRCRGREDSGIVVRGSPESADGVVLQEAKVLTIGRENQEMRKEKGKAREMRQVTRTTMVGSDFPGEVERHQQLRQSAVAGGRKRRCCH
jgi:hypothetical protein